MRLILFLMAFYMSIANALSSEQSGSDNSAQNLYTENIVYEVDGIQLTGYMAYDKTLNTKRPGILIVHEWWGHNEYVRMRAKMLANLGYIAFAVDMYGDGKLAEHPKDAAKFMNEVTSNMSIAEKRLDVALELLKSQSLTDNKKIAAIGYCFGGAMVLHLARTGIDIDGAVSFHGSLATQSPAQKGTVRAQILVFNGKEDSFISRKQVHDFLEEMNAADVDFEFIDYPNVKHSFTNPMADKYRKEFDLPALEYNAHADEDSWERLQEFLIKIFE